MATDTIPARMLGQAVSQSGSPAYWVRTEAGWESTSWADYGAEISDAARALIALGSNPGDTVAIIGFNRPEWVVFDVAAMAIGGLPAGIYTTSSPTEIAYVLNHSEAAVLLVEDEAQLKKVQSVRADLPHLRHIVTMRGVTDTNDDMVMAWDQFLARRDGATADQLQERLDSLGADDPATLIYTSGTTGPPKAVMLSHDNLAWTATQAAALLEAEPSDRNLSYLPLSHIAEQVFTIHGQATAGYQVYFAESIERLPDNLQEVKPTFFFAVPRVWEKFQAGIAAEGAKVTGVKAKIGAWARGVGLQVAVQRNQGDSPSMWLGAQYALAERLVFDKVRAAVGLGESKLLVSGAAPVSREVLEFLASLGLVVFEVYGQSEDTGPTSFNVPGRAAFGSVGPAFPGTQVKIADDGEVLVKGRNVFLGYYKDQQATDATLADGWLHSGDLGEFDENGLLWITGRKKDLIITAGGKNVAPKNIEAGIKNHPLVSEVVVIGDRRRFLTALITLDPEAADAFLSERGESGPAADAASVRASIQEAVDATNEHLARVEQVKKFTILPRELSIEDGELTPTLKVKRNVVTDHFAAAIDAMYE